MSILGFYTALELPQIYCTVSQIPLLVFRGKIPKPSSQICGYGYSLNHFLKASLLTMIGQKQRWICSLFVHSNNKRRLGVCLCTLHSFFKWCQTTLWPSIHTSAQYYIFYFWNIWCSHGQFKLSLVQCIIKNRYIVHLRKGPKLCMGQSHLSIY